MVDSTEPVGPAVKLFTKGFYAGIYEALKEDGIFVAQTDNPWFKADLIRKVQRDVREIFPIRAFIGLIFRPIQADCGHLQWVLKKYDPLEVRGCHSMK